jgi:hypothetical protein
LCKTGYTGIITKAAAFLRNRYAGVMLSLKCQTSQLYKSLFVIVIPLKNYKVYALL